MPEDPKDPQDPKGTGNDPTGTGSGESAEGTGAGTTQTGEGTGQGAPKSGDFAAELRLNQKLARLQSENEKLTKAAGERAEAEKTEHQKALDKAVAEAKAESAVDFERQKLGFGIQRSLVSAGVKEEAVQAIAEVVQGKYPDIKVEDIPKAVKETIELLGIQPVTPVGKGTGGAPTGGAPATNNPWSKDGWNRTKQWQITEEKGEAEAKKLAATVGSFLDATKPPE